MGILSIYSPDFVTCGFSESIGYDMKMMHIHEVYEIFMPLCDNVRFFVSSRMYQLERGDVILFTNNDLHKVSVPPDMLYKRCVITFPADKLCTRMADGKQLLSCFENSEQRHLKLSPEEQARFLELAENIRQEGEGGDFSEAAQWLNLGQILLLLCRAGESSRQWPETERDGFSYTSRVLDYIDEHYRENISLDALSDLCFLNKSYLCRLFKRETGFHIHDYIVYRRLSSAMVLLQQGESVSTAAQLAGFSSDTFFITVFRKNLGMTPYQYAKKRPGRP